MYECKTFIGCGTQRRFSLALYKCCVTYLQGVLLDAGCIQMLCYILWMCTAGCRLNLI